MLMMIIITIISNVTNVIAKYLQGFGTSIIINNNIKTFLMKKDIKKDLKKDLKIDKKDVKKDGKDGDGDGMLNTETKIFAVC